MLLTPAVSVLVGIWALAVARRARARAEAADLRAEESTRVAQEAIASAREAQRVAQQGHAVAKMAAASAAAVPVDLAWDEMAIAVSALETFSPASSDQDVSPYITAVTSRASLLAKRLDWAGFNEWVAAEVRLGLVLMRDASARSRTLEMPSIDDIVRLNGTYWMWVGAFSQNLRRFRTAPARHHSLGELRDLARTQTTMVSERNGWLEPAE